MHGTAKLVMTISAAREGEMKKYAVHGMVAVCNHHRDTRQWVGEIGCNLQPSSGWRSSVEGEKRVLFFRGEGVVDHDRIRTFFIGGFCFVK